MRISLENKGWTVQGWVPQEWELVGVRQLVTANLDIGKMLHGETAPIPASVPGCVQADLARSGVIADPYVGLNSRSCEWAQHRNWLYQKRFTLRPDFAGRKLRLIFNGIDYSGRAWLNGTLLGRHEGTFIPAEFDITGVAKLPPEENNLVVIIDPAPDVPGQVGYSNLIRHLKPRFGYKWDFTTRLVQLGLWDDVEVAATGPAHIDNVFVRPRFSAGGVTAGVQTTLVSSAFAHVKLDVTVRLGKDNVASAQTMVAINEGRATAGLDLRIRDPRRWWPNGLGEQPIYTAYVRLTADGDEWDTHAVNFGLREIEMVQNDAAPDGADPYTMVVNGRKVFLKGWNFVPVDHRYGLPNDEKYEWLVRLARHANVNILRVWGGGIIEKEIFYNLCDLAGILVWQEMPQSSSGLSNEPPVDPEFLTQLKAVARAGLRRRRNHPCLAIWCGGNELAGGPDNLQPLSADHPNLAAIAEVVREEAPHLVYRPTSPYGPAYDPKPENFGRGLHHDVHGPWKYQGVEGQYELFNANDCLFHSEAGAEGCACEGSIRACVPEGMFWPPDKTNRYWVHHAGWWVNTDVIGELFGPPRNIDEFITATQFVQAEALRYVIESNRRRKFRCGGSMLWQMNEPWPNVSATTCVDWYGVPKPAYYFVARACRPRHISLQYPRLDWQPGRTFEADVFVHNSLHRIARADAVCTIYDVRGTALFRRQWRLELPENSCTAVEHVAWPVPAGVDLFIVRLDLQIGGGDAPIRNEYLFPVGGNPVLAPLAGQPPATVQCASQGAAAHGPVLRLSNTGTVAALMATVEPDGVEAFFADDNALVLLPGE
ncbi:MAG TPA: glycoside hydrolase family 2 TIM barrel-domain containing protein, partial [Planctomycetota bacterium]|nr:glycoside hydrolase family 2 TIM barrel-domain containing protein [Planctomycetota bacterium]